MDRNDVNINVSLKGITLAQLIMANYDKFHANDFIKEEEFREKMMLLCKNKKFDFNKKTPVNFYFSSFSFLFHFLYSRK